MSEEKKKSKIDQCMLIPLSDLPDKKALVYAAERLQKDYDILSSYKIGPRKEEAEQFKAAISVLLMIASKCK